MRVPEKVYSIMLRCHDCDSTVFDRINGIYHCIQCGYPNVTSDMYENILEFKVVEGESNAH